MMKSKDIKKVDLHLHLDGSLSLQVIEALVKDHGMDLKGDSLKSQISVGTDCRSLVDYLRCFELPLRLLQTEDALILATKDLVKRLFQSGLSYCEIRFAPQLHTDEGMSQQQVVEAVLKGVREVHKSGYRLPLGILLCMMVTGEERANRETAELSAAYLKRGVVGLDLAGAEGAVPMSQFKPLFTLAYQADVPFTIHTGECGSYDNIAEAVAFGARRIGHGCGAIFSESCMNLLEREKIVLEMCPTSNLQTKAVASIEAHPIRRFFDRGMQVTVNTDNMTVSDTTLEQEYRLLKEKLRFTDDELAAMGDMALRAAFLRDFDIR